MGIITTGGIRIRRVQDDKSDTSAVKGIVQRKIKCRLVIDSTSTRCTFIARETLSRTNYIVFFVKTLVAHIMIFVIPYDWEECGFRQHLVSTLEKCRPLWCIIMPCKIPTILASKRLDWFKWDRLRFLPRRSDPCSSE